MSNEPSTGQFTGIDALARKPDATVLIVDDIARESTAQLFGGMAVLGAIGQPKPDMLKGRAVVLWLSGSGAAESLAASVAPVATSVRTIDGTIVSGKPVLSFTNAAPAIAYAKANMRAYSAPQPAAVVGPAERPKRVPHGPQAAPAGSEAYVAAHKAKFGVVEPDGSVRAPTPGALEQEEPLPEGFSQDALAAQFTERHHEWRHVSEWGKWYAWDGQRWAQDTVLTVFNLGRHVCRDAAHAAHAMGASPGAVRTIQSANTIAAVERIARADPVHAMRTDVWDADPWALNTPDGIIDLTNGSLRAATPDAHMTKITRASATNTVPARWLEFLADATQRDAELIAFLQRAAGYCLTGITREHALFFVYGTGGNGKGTFLNTLTWILGDYAQVASMETFTEARGERHPTELAGLMGSRLVSAQETEEGRRWAESRIKALTGGDPIRARFMRQDEFTFQPQFKLVIVGNHKPGLRNVDDAIRRRLYLIPFTATIPSARRDPMLTEKLRQEAGGILQWALQGCLEWQRIGLAAPERVRVATDQYLAGQDTLATWMEECCEVGRPWSCKLSVLYGSYREWAEKNNEAILGRRRFSEALESRGYETKQDGANYLTKGLHLLSTQK